VIFPHFGAFTPFCDGKTGDGGTIPAFRARFGDDERPVVKSAGRKPDEDGAVQFEHLIAGAKIRDPASIRNS
jgi:hypothetical protein